MFNVDQPAMALNDTRAPAAAQMWNSWDVYPHYKRSEIINWTARVASGAPGGKLKSIVVCSHALPGDLILGEGFQKQHSHLFAAWKNLVDIIFFHGCELAAGDGYQLCSEIAFYAKCYVVVSTELQSSGEGLSLLPPGQLDVYEGWTLTFGPNGKLANKLRFPSRYVGD